jgi:Trehalose utilisation
MPINPHITGIVLCLAMAFVAAPTHADTAPPESTSKVKRVLLYNKVGGWYAQFGIPSVTRYLASLARTKGFELDTLNADTNLTLEYLKQYQVIVWNNNSNGAVSVPTASARDAIVEYVNQGGGWFLLGLAGDHQDTWPALTDMLGTKFERWGTSGTARMQADASAFKHPELRFVVNSIYSNFHLYDTWMSFGRTVRPLANVTVLYTAVDGAAEVLPSNPNWTTDRTYVWARTIEKGRLLYCPPGWSSYQPLAQLDSLVARIYWNSIRWLAGDFQRGCMNPKFSTFDPDARIDDGSCIVESILVEGLRSKPQPRRAKEPVVFPSRAPLIKGEENGASRDVRGRMIHLPEVTPKPDPKN